MARHDAALLTAPELLARLVGFNTVSHRSNLPLVEFVRDYLAAHGVAARLIASPDGGKANLHAIIGPQQAGGLALSGHVDTVSAEGQSWTGDPFTLRRQDGRLVGRGACDMKGFVAAALAAVPAIRARRPQRPVHLLLTYDEEVGYHGVRRLVEEFAVSGLKPAMCVVGEPSGMLPILGQKGRLIVRVRIRGHGAHSSESQNGVNAVHAAGEAIAWLAARSRQLGLEGPHEGGFVPTCSTLQVGGLASQGLPSSVPHEAVFDIEWRSIPGHPPREELERFQAFVRGAIERPMQALRPETGFAWETLLDLDALSLPPEHELARAALAATGMTTGGKVSFCSEGAFYQPAGIASMVCGPGHLAQVHQPDEWVGEDQLAACERFILALVDRLAC